VNDHAGAPGISAAVAVQGSSRTPPDGEAGIEREEAQALPIRNRPALLPERGRVRLRVTPTTRHGFHRSFRNRSERVPISVPTGTRTSARPTRLANPHRGADQPMLGRTDRNAAKLPYNRLR